MSNNTKAFFEPASVAVVGASANPDKVGYAVMANLINAGYKGRIIPVNPKSDEILGIPCVNDIDSMDEAPDLAAIVVPAKAVLPSIQALGRKGTKAAVIISAGFREVGPEGREMEDAVVAAGREYGMTLIGPNCLGLLNTGLPLNASFSKDMPPPGSIGVISQSGAFCTSLIDWSIESRVGFSKLLSLGNMADMDESDAIEALMDDPATNVIIMYVEGVADGQRFLKVLREAGQKKPVVILKSGNTSAGAKAASSHTGSLAGSEAAYDAAFEQSSVMRVKTVEELLTVSIALSEQPLPQGRNIVVVTNAGGPGIIASDACENAGLNMAVIDGDTLEKLEGFMPSAGSTHNPIDVLGDADPALYERAARTALEDPDIHAALIILTPQAMTKIDEIADEIVVLNNAVKGKPIMTAFMGAGSVDDAVAKMQEAGVPNMPYPDTAMNVFGRMYERYEHTQRAESSVPRIEVDAESVAKMIASYRAEGIKQIETDDCHEVLEAYRIPYAGFELVQAPEDAVAAAEKMGYPIVMKIASPQIVHKTDVGGVVLDLNSAQEVEDAYYDVLLRCHEAAPEAELYGVTIQQMLPPGKEIIIGMFRDPQFGPMVMVGLGGVYVETFKDVSFRLAPLTTRDTKAMIEELKAYTLLKGVRGEAAADIAAIEDVINRISRLAVDNPEILEMDINPLLVYEEGKGAVCVDIRIALGD